MTRHFLWLLLLCGCSFDLSALGPQDGGFQDDAQIEASDAEMLADAQIEASDAEMLADASPDSHVDEDAGTDSGPPSITCLNAPNISGRYRIGRHLMMCSLETAGVATLTRVDDCRYTSNGSDPDKGPFFEGSCNVIIEGTEYRYECVVLYRYTTPHSTTTYRYRCELTPDSTGLFIDCRPDEAGNPWPDPCVFHAPEV